MARYFLNTGILWSDVNNWSDTDGGAGGFSVPTATDDVFFTANSGPCTLNGANRLCRALDTTGYNGTITITTIALTTAGNVTLSNTTTLNGSGIFAFNGNPTVTRNGANVAVATCRHVTTGTVTFADAWQVINWNCSGAGGTLNGSTLSISGNLTMTAAVAAGTTNFVLNGTGTQTWAGNFSLANNLTINKSSGNFIVSGNVQFGIGKTLTYTTSGSVTTTGSVLTTSACSLDTSGMIWANVNCTGAFVRTLLSDLYCTQFTVTGNASTCNGFNVYINGNLAFNTTAGTVCGGTTAFHLVGTGNWSHGSTGRFANNLTINTAGTITCTTNPVYIGGGTFTYVAGNIVNANITFTASCTINASGFTFGTIRFNAGTFTFNQDFNCDSFNQNSVFTFTFTSATTKTINCNSCSFTSGSIVNLKAGMRINVATSLTLNCTIQSTTAASAFLNLAYGASQAVTATSATWINSIGGQTIYTTVGPLSNTVNWNIGTYNSPTSFLLMF